MTKPGFLFLLAAAFHSGAVSPVPPVLAGVPTQLKLRGAEEAVLDRAADVGVLMASDHSRATVNAGAKVAYVDASGDAAVIIDGGRVSHLDASGRTTVTLKGGAEIAHVNLSGDAAISVSGATVASLSVHGRSRAQIHELTVQGGIFSAPNVSFSGGAVAYSADARIHIHATDVDLYDGRISGLWGTGAPFAFMVIEAKGSQPSNFIYSQPRSLPPQIVVHDVVVAGFDCSKAALVVEKTVCADRGLARLDRRLARQYEQALAAAPAGTDVRASQRRWLSTVRDRCPDSACIRSAYERRSAELQRLVTPHGPGYVPLISETRAQAVCDEVVRLANVGALEQRMLRFTQTPSPSVAEQWYKLSGGFPSLADLLEVDYNREGKKRRVAVIYTGGSCSSSEIIDLDLALASAPQGGARYVGYTDLEAENDNALRWANWGRDDYFLFVHGEPIVVAASFYRATEVALVSWFGEGRKRPLCAVAPTGAITLRITQDRNPALCRLVARQGETPVASSKMSDEAVAALRTDEQRIDHGVTMRIDANLDGRLDTIARFEHASSAGCGSTHQWLVALSADGKPAPSSALSTALGVFEGAIGDLRLFTFEGKPYILGRDEQDVVGVHSVWRDRRQTWCAFRLLPQFKIGRLYPIR